jgi:hypothetical protein
MSANGTRLNGLAFGMTSPEVAYLQFQDRELTLRPCGKTLKHARLKLDRPIVRALSAADCPAVDLVVAVQRGRRAWAPSRAITLMGAGIRAVTRRIPAQRTSRTFH